MQVSGVSTEVPQQGFPRVVSIADGACVLWGEVLGSLGCVHPAACGTGTGARTGTRRHGSAQVPLLTGAWGAQVIAVVTEGLTCCASQLTHTIMKVKPVSVVAFLTRCEPQSVCAGGSVCLPEPSGLLSDPASFCVVNSPRAFTPHPR